MTRPAPGTVGWLDLTVGDAEAIRDFYQEVVGWKTEPLDMGGYADFVMSPPGGGEAAAGICHARGTNADLPPVWLAYLVVEDLDASLKACRAGGGEVLHERRQSSGGLAVIRDPAGAVCALYQVPAE